MAEVITNQDSEDDNDFESIVKARAEELVISVGQGDFGKAIHLIHQLNEARDNTLFKEVGKLTRALHTAITNFQIDTSMRMGETEQQEMSQMKDASDRLAYVIGMTEKSANTTMDMVEISEPIANDLRAKAAELHTEWGRLQSREMKPEEFRVLYARIDEFLMYTVDKADNLHANLNNILMAQDYQDLTGQVIKRVITLVREVEEHLVKLVRMASRVDAAVGIRHDDIKVKEVDVLAGEGPSMSAKAGVVSNQDEVDDLLSSLGF